MGQQARSSHNQDRPGAARNSRSGQEQTASQTASQAGKQPEAAWGNTDDSKDGQHGVKSKPAQGSFRGTDGQHSDKGMPAFGMHAGSTHGQDRGHEQARARSTQRQRRGNTEDNTGGQHWGGGRLAQEGSMVATQKTAENGNTGASSCLPPVVQATGLCEHALCWPSAHRATGQGQWQKGPCIGTSAGQRFPEPSHQAAESPADRASASSGQRPTRPPGNSGVGPLVGCLLVCASLAFLSFCLILFVGCLFIS